MTTSPVMAWLSEGVPVTLLCDLAAVSAPRSVEICAVERPADDPIWDEAAREHWAGLLTSWDPRARLTAG